MLQTIQRLKFAKTVSALNGVIMNKYLPIMIMIFILSWQLIRLIINVWTILCVLHNWDVRLHYAQAEKNEIILQTTKWSWAKPCLIMCAYMHICTTPNTSNAGKQSKAEWSEQMSKGYDYHSGWYYSAESTISFA